MFEKFYDMYESEEHEVIALMGRCVGYSYEHNCGCYSIDAVIMGAIFCDSSDTSKLVTRAMHLHWPADDKDVPTDKGYKRFEVGQVCRLKIRKLKDECAEQSHHPRYGQSFADQRHIPRYALSEVLVAHEDCPALNRVLAEYQDEVELQDEVLGTLTLDKDFEKLRGQVKWCGLTIELCLDVDAFDKDSWSKPRIAAKSLVSDCVSWDDKMIEYAAHEFTESYNETHGCDYDVSDYLDISEDEGEFEELSEEDFASRLTMVKLDIALDGSFKAYFDCDNLFFDSFITVTGSVQDGIKDADIEDR